MTPETTKRTTAPGLSETATAFGEATVVSREKGYGLAERGMEYSSKLLHSPQTPKSKTIRQVPASAPDSGFKTALATCEYLLVLSPHEELSNRIVQVKKDFHESFQATTAAWGKPRVALVTFTQLALMEERILRRLRAIAMGYCPFKVELKDFGSFPSHTIFINVISKLPIRGLLKEVREAQQLMKLDKENKPHFIDEPHLTIASKLVPWQYEKGWGEYSQRHFTGRFIADSMLLLRRQQGARAWQIAERLEFRNLPIATKQGELFD